VIPPGRVVTPDGTTTPRTVRVTAAAAAVFWGVLFFGLIDLFAFAQGEEFHASLLLSTGWGLLFVALVAAPLCTTAFARTAASGSVTAELVAVAFAMLIAAVVSLSARHLLPVAGVVATAWLVVRRTSPRRPALLLGWRPSWTALAAVAVAAGPFGYYAWTSVRTAGTSTITDDTWGLDHWPVQAALPLAAVLVAGIAAGHPTGWRTPMWSVAAAAAWFATVSWAEPDLTGSVGRWWAIALAIWALLFVTILRRASPPNGLSQPTG
jgi:hypothetical protein